MKNETQKTRQEELTVLWTRAQSVVAGFISTLVPDFQDADDILQNVAVILVSKFDEYDRSRSFTTWAVGIARNEILRYYEKGKGREKCLSQEAIDQLGKAYCEENENISNLKSELKRCVSKLRGKWKLVVELHYYSGFAPARIAQKLGMTTNSIYVLMHRIRLALKDCVMKASGIK
ncbi:RNA polymerase sigma factor [Sedimentisphaera cyanobacteriorum]|uniref:RNA polymerase sigma factor n=1 Tax=Sedimentisphaera cyanobacteriorum TaxID=1940790 RepID=A0A1Q2HLP6_9BACT|nr:sigma-70 family RNA polymerase sigma factor [Sedimentisphaera cyanobacteriorum]AQQ08270.1 RNA polymerase sigma factor [Sedimentisphaera cyanobacteriorum]